MKHFARSVAAVALIAGAGVFAPMAVEASPLILNFTNYSCNAGTCTGSATTNFTTTDFAVQFDIPQFNSVLGTLTYQEVDISAGLQGVGALSNTGSATSGITISSSGVITNQSNVTIPLSGGTTVSGNNNGDTNLNFTGTTTATSATQNIGAGTVGTPTTISNIAVPAGGGQATFANNSTIFFGTGLGAHQFDSNLIGTGTNNQTFQTGEYTLIGGSGGNLTASIATQDTITLSVLYQYTAASTPVPEPASIALLGVGLAGLGLIRRAKASKAG